MDETQGLDERARDLWSWIGAASGFLIGAALGALLVLANAPLAAPLPALALAAGGWAYARLLWSRWSWQELPAGLELRHGVVVLRASWIPYHRIQQIDIERGPLERWRGLAQLVVRTASATTDATLPGLAEPEAQRLRAHLLARAGADDAV